MEKNEYMVYFDFTTVKGNKFTGRSGKLDCTTEMTLEELKNDQEDLKKACAQFIHSKYPKWNIFMINIKDIKTVTNGK